MDSSRNGDMTGAAKMLMGATMRSSGQQIQKTLTDAVHIELLRDNMELAEELASKEFMKRTKLPTQKEFLEWIVTIGTHKEVAEKTNLKLTKVEHWYRKDITWFSYPTIEDWTEIKKHYQVPKELDYKMTYQESIEWKGMLKTPTASDKNGGCTRGNPKLQMGSSLVNQMHEVCKTPRGKTSQLNTRFVMEMMGFPKDWTELPFLNGEKNHSKQGETQ
jgi:hypothetical protein